ncbi:MAG: T9SS type A sorting domain-containing protein, partial [Cyclobacteriaceae bacterium]|nr:T9SS type A sorting domain-containing protein [Cyclobacteriaceae bacterium]
SYVYSLHELGSFDYAIRSSVWNYYEVFFYAPNSNFDQIWIRPQVEPSLLNQSIENQRNNWITIDDFSLRIENGGFCAPNVLIDNSTVINPLIQAGLTMKTEGSVTIQNGVSTTFRAGQQLVLKSGFTAMSGSTFTATIGECVNGAGSRSEDTALLVEFDNYEVNYLQKPRENSNYLMEPREGNENENENGNAEGGINVYPNPAERNFFVKGIWSDEKYLEIDVINMLGVVIDNFILGQATYVDVIVPLDKYSAGVYIIRIRRGDEVINKSIVVK